MRKALAVAIAFFINGLALGTAAEANCGKQFWGLWILDASGYGQENRTEFLYNLGFDWTLTSQTGTRRWGNNFVYPDIEHLKWGKKYGNMSVKALKGGKCQVTLRRPRVEFRNLGGRYDNSLDTNVGVLTVSGRTLKWCWTNGSNKVMGNCNTYRR